VHDNNNIINYYRRRRRLLLRRSNDGSQFPCGRVRVGGDRSRRMPRGRKYNINI